MGGLLAFWALNIRFLLFFRRDSIRDTAEERSLLLDCSDELLDCSADDVDFNADSVESSFCSLLLVVGLSLAIKQKKSLALYHSPNATAF